MSLMFCPECKKEISSEAVSCPNCGFPLKRPQAVELTDKGSKLAILFSIALCCASSSIFALGYFHNAVPKLIQNIAAISFFFGFFIFLGARLTAWWRRG